MREELALRQLPKRTMALVLAGGRGSRLKNLTDLRAKPAVPFGGKFRIIDFTLSNCLNSGIRRVYVLTQYKSQSLLRHIQRGWGNMRSEMNEFVDVLPAQQQVEEHLWYRGTADAVWQNIDLFQRERGDFILVLAGDHVYKMDYGAMEDHVARRAEVSIACLEVPRAQAGAFGVMAVDDGDRVTGFLEKPADPPGLPDRPELTLASMGVYVFNAPLLYEALTADAADVRSSHDFGKDIIPALLDRARVLAHRFATSCIRRPPQPECYWRDVGTVDAYWEANMDLTQVTPVLDLYDTSWPIHTYQPQLPPAKFVFNQETRRGVAIDSLVSGGCIVSGARVIRSLLSSEVRVNSFVEVDLSVVLPECNIGRHARIRKAIIDKACTIPEGLVVGYDAEQDASRFYRSEGGVTLITRDMLAALARQRSGPAAPRTARPAASE